MIYKTKNLLHLLTLLPLTNLLVYIFNILYYMKLKNLINLVIIALIISACGDSNKKKPDGVDKIEGKVKKIEVGVQTLKKQNFQKQLISNGKISSAQSCIIRPQSGIIQKLNIRNGQKVNEGDTLAVLENKEKKLQLKKAVESIKEKEVDLLDKLMENGYYKLEDTAKIESQKLKLFKSRSGYTNAVHQLTEAKMNLEKTFVTAPFSGIIANMTDQVFDQISSEFCTLYNPDKMAIDFKLLEMDIGSIYVNQRVVISPFNQPDLKLQASISEINPIVDENGLVKIKAHIKAGQKANLFNGQNARILVEHSIPDQFVVPREAIVLRSNKFVMFHYENGYSKWVYVNILYENEKSYAIIGTEKGSLKEGYKVIISNNLNLAHDAEVDLLPTKNE